MADIPDMGMFTRVITLGKDDEKPLLSQEGLKIVDVFAVK